MAEPRRRRLDVAAHVEGVLAGDRSVLARTITLVESSAAAHAEKAETVLKELMPHTGGSVRVGITGSPGVGKSTFIEAFGMMLCDEGHRVAVLAVDPSSSVTRGSILGDKTRMERLSRDERAFIRPSPAAGTLGGVTRKSRETILLCEAAGFDVILVETVGVGQSEIAVRSMVDFFLLLLLPGAGDELQGIKKGILEIADLLVVNKADGASLPLARQAARDLSGALRILQPEPGAWQPKVMTASSLQREGLDAVWETVREHRRALEEAGEFARLRARQQVRWMWAQIEDRLFELLRNAPAVADALPSLEAEVEAGRRPPTVAAEEIIELFLGRRPGSAH
jgi:LAO/AO transport system kinase